MQGGVISAKSRILVVGFLTDTIPANLITGKTLMKSSCDWKYIKLNSVERVQMTDIKVEELLKKEKLR